MDSIRVSEAPDPGSIPGKATTPVRTVHSGGPFGPGQYKKFSEVYLDSKESGLQI